MAVVVICVLLLAVGVAAVVRSGSLEIVPPGPPLSAPARFGEVAKRYLWWVTLAFYTGVATAITVVGPAGRLVMRILAVTAPAAATGRRTEAEEIVGRISVDGTIGIFVFVGLLFGLASAVVYLLLRRWFPKGHVGGLAFGAFLIVIGGTRLDPLRPDNPDFDIVGPGWLAIVLFVAMALLQGTALVAWSARLSRILPEMSRRPHTVVANLVPILFFVPAFFFGVTLLLAFALTFFTMQIAPLVAGIRSRRFHLAGAIALAILAIASAPQTIGALVTIAGKP